MLNINILSKAKVLRNILRRIINFIIIWFILPFFFFFYKGEVIKWLYV